MCGPIVPGNPEIPGKKPARRPAHIPKNPLGATKGRKKILRPESVSDYERWLKSQRRRFNRTVVSQPEPIPKPKPRRVTKGEEVTLPEPNARQRRRPREPDVGKPDRPTDYQRKQAAKKIKPKKPVKRPEGSMTRYPPRKAGESALDYEKRLRAWRRRMGK